MRKTSNKHHRALWLSFYRGARVSCENLLFFSSCWAVDSSAVHFSDLRRGRCSTGCREKCTRTDWRTRERRIEWKVERERGTMANEPFVPQMCFHERNCCHGNEEAARFNSSSFTWQFTIALLFSNSCAIGRTSKRVDMEKVSLDLSRTGLLAI